MLLLSFLFVPWAGFLSDGDLCSLVFLIWLLIFIGSRVIQFSPPLQLCGLKIAATVALVQVAADIDDSGLRTPAEALRIVLRALAAGGVTLGPAWMTLAIGSYFRELFRRMTNAATSRAMPRQRERERRHREAEESERKRQREAEWERTRPQREQAVRDAAERSRAEAERRQQEDQRKLSDRKCREDAKLRCVLVYDRFAAALAKSFPRDQLDQYFAAYMSETHAAEAVEARAQQLIQMQEELASEQGNRSKARFQSLADVAAYFHQQREQIQSLPYDHDTLDSLLMLLNQYEEAAIADFLRTSTR